LVKLNKRPPFHLILLRGSAKNGKSGKNGGKRGDKEGFFRWANRGDFPKKRGFGKKRLSRTI